MAMKFYILIKNSTGYIMQVSETKYSVPMLSYDLFCDGI